MVQLDQKQHTFLVLPKRYPEHASCPPWVSDEKTCVKTRRQDPKIARTSRQAGLISGIQWRRLTYWRLRLLIGITLDNILGRDGLLR
jgi:hypothetical protein